MHATIALLLSCTAARGAIIPSRSEAPPHPADEVIGTTTARVPDLLRAKLQGLAPIDEKISDRYPAREAVAKLQWQMGWNATTSDFNHPQPLEALHVGDGRVLLAAADLGRTRGGVRGGLTGGWVGGAG